MNLLLRGCDRRNMDTAHSSSTDGDKFVKLSPAPVSMHQYIIHIHHASVAGSINFVWNFVWMHVRDPRRGSAAVAAGCMIQAQKLRSLN